VHRALVTRVAAPPKGERSNGPRSKAETGKQPTAPFVATGDRLHAVLQLAPGNAVHHEAEQCVSLREDAHGLGLPGGPASETTAARPDATVVD